jgi:predicted extracellular nuclease
MNTHTRLYRLWTLAAIAAMLVAMVPSPVADFSSAQAATGDPVLLNEILASHAGTDDTEFVELYGTPGTSLDGLSFVAVESSNIASNGGYDDRYDFGPGDALGSNGFFLIGNASGLGANYGVTPDIDVDLNLENDNTTYALVETSSLSGSSVTGGEIVRDAVAAVDGDGGTFYFDAPIVGPDGSFFPAGVRRAADGVDTDAASDWLLADFDLGEANTPTPGQEEVAPPPDVALNEIVVSTASTDREFFEVAGGAGVSLGGVTFLEVTSGGSIDTVLDLSSESIPADGFWVATSPEAESVLGVTGDFGFANNTLTNDSQTYLLVYNFSGASGDDIDADDDGVIDNPLWDSILDDVAIVANDSPIIYSASVVGPDGSFLAAGGYRCPDISGSWNMHDFSDYSDYTPGSANACGSPTADVLINEVDADTPGTDTLEFVELFDGGTGSTALDGLTVVFFNGSDDASYDAFDLDGYSTNGDGYFVLGNAGVSPTPSIIFGSNGLQNGADAVALYAGNAADFPNDTAVTTAGLIDAIVYDTNDGDDSGLLPLLNAGQPQVNEGGGGSSASDSNQRCPNGSGGLRNTDTYEQWAPTPGEANLCEPEVIVAKIHDVQGSGSSSPLQGSTVQIEGVVVGDFQDGAAGTNGDLDGFFVQEEDADVDADPMTSEGVFVYDGSSPSVDVSVGDLVQVVGGVSEHFGLTEISSFGGVTLMDSGVPLPTAASLSLPVTAETDFEAYEDMRVAFAQDLVISEYFNFDRFGEIVLTGHRHLTPTAEFEPGAAAIAAAEAYVLDRITLDDGRSTQNPDPALHPAGGIFNLSHRFRGGDTISGLTGVMHYDFGLYRIQPTDGGTYHEVNPRPATPADVGGDLNVASFNVLNYFTTLDDGVHDICGPSGNLECRGADDANELTRQRAKIVAALQAIDADVFGLIEIQNDLDQSVADLVSGLNDAMGAGTFDYISTGYIGTDAIKQALIYKPASVTPVGAYAILDSTVDPRFVDTKNRPVLAQAFQDNSTGEVFTVAVNHLKSKGSDCDALGDPDTGDGQGNCNLTRKAAAEALVDWLATDPTGSGSPYTLIMGDLNSYDHEDPIDAIKAGSDDAAYTADDWTDLIFQYLGEDAYSYVFDGQIGYLDHGLSNYATLAHVTGTTIWHINADEPDILDYDTSFKQAAQAALYEPNAYRSSDHDPVIVGLNFSSISPEAVEALEELLNHFADSGDITGNNTAKALLDHLEKAASYLASGKDAAAEAQLQAFINQTQGKAPQFVTQEAADVLSAVASALLGE